MYLTGRPDIFRLKVKIYFRGTCGYLTHQIVVYLSLLPKYCINFIEYFVDENKYIMEGVAMFSLLITLINIAKKHIYKNININI